jgi:hypothetical protein
MGPTSEPYDRLGAEAWGFDWPWYEEPYEVGAALDEACRAGSDCP